jgi:hypothetical protein
MVTTSLGQNALFAQVKLCPTVNQVNVRQQRFINLIPEVSYAG